MILLVGNRGSIGSRYEAILKWEKISYCTYDILDGLKPIDWKKIDRVIVATPTDQHAHWAFIAADHDLPVLVEKPLSKSLEECETLERALKGHEVFVVCNYKYALGPNPKIFYDYYNTGKDGLWWDVCQLIYLDPDAKISNESPFLNLWVNEKLVRYREIEASYCKMVKDFAEGKYRNLWTLEDGVKMTRAVLERMKHEGAIGGSESERVEEISRQSL